MSKKVEERKCVICGKKFTPKSVNAKCCSTKCSKALKAKRDKARKVAKKVAVKAVAKKPVKKVVKAKCVEKVVLPKKPTIEVKKVSDERMVTIGLSILMTALGKILGKTLAKR